MSRIVDEPRQGQARLVLGTHQSHGRPRTALVPPPAPSPPAARTSGASTRRGGWCWDGLSWSWPRSLHGRGGDMRAPKTTADKPALRAQPIAHDRARALLGQVMGFVAVTVGFAALGAYLGRDLSGATGLVLFIGAFACIVGLNVAAAKGREQLAIGLLFGLGLLSDSRSPPSSPTTPTPTHPLCGRRPEPPRRSSPGAAPTATRRAATSRRGRAPCSGRCSACSSSGSSRSSSRSPTATSSTPSPGSGSSARSRSRLQPAAPRGRRSAVQIAASIFLDIFNIFLLAAPAVRRSSAN